MQISVRQPRIRALLAQLLGAGLDAVDPVSAVTRHVTRRGQTLRIGDTQYRLGQYPHIVVLGAGKASGCMGVALERLLGDRLDKGLVVVKYGHAVKTKSIRVVEAGHPIPDQNGQRAATQALALAKSLRSHDLMLVLLSGGASSLLPAPLAGVSLSHKQKTTQLLLRSGATIQEVNAVRKHLSAIKGGRLLAATRARVASLILSDVIGDDVETIGSGPTAADSTTYADACDVLHRFGLWRRVPSSVRATLRSGMHGRLPETPKPGDALFKRVQNLIIGNNAGGVQAVVNAARQEGFHPLVLSTSLIGEARAAAKVFGAVAREIVGFQRPVRRPACLIAGGELTVTVAGNGRGGRAQEFALASALDIAGLKNTVIAGFGTDGSDGPTNVAGAVVDGSTVTRARRLRIDPRKFLERNDSYHFFNRVGGHIRTGPTRTNVNDLYLLLVL